MKITPGTVIRDNDPRMPYRNLRVRVVGTEYARCSHLAMTNMTARVRLDRIHTDGKPRKSGFSVVTWGPQE